MIIKRVNVTRERLLDVESPEWGRAEAEQLPLVATPLRLQPSVYVKSAWKGKDIGKVKMVSLRALHNGEDVFFRLEWEDPGGAQTEAADTSFPDGAALLFPLEPSAPMLTMGKPTAPVNAWHWRADWGEKGRNNVARGLGTTQPTESSHIVCRATWRAPRWLLVMARPLVVSDQRDEAAQLEPGKATQVGVAVWEGGNGERAGVKAYSKAWREIALEV